MNEAPVLKEKHSYNSFQQIKERCGLQHMKPQNQHP